MKSRGFLSFINYNSNYLCIDYLFCIIHVTLIEIRCAHSSWTFHQHNICAYLQNWLYHPKQCENLRSQQYLVIYMNTCEGNLLHCMFILISSWCLLHSVCCGDTGNYRQKKRPNFLPQHATSWYYSIFIVNASDIRLVRVSNFECMLNILGSYYPTVFCFLVLWSNFLCTEKWMLMSSCPVILSYLFQTWKWKQGGGAICWLWWIPATYSCNRNQWPHTGEWW
jgi:hypothetical protein